MHTGALFDRADDENAMVTTRDVASALFRRWRTVLGCTVGTTVLAAAGVAQLSPSYETHAKVFIQTERQLMPSFFAGLAPYSRRQEWDPASRRLENEMAQIDVRPIAARVVHELGLTWQDVAHSPVSQLLHLVRARTAPIAARVGLPLRPPTEADTIEAFRASLTVSPAESRSAETTSNVIVVTLRAPSAEGARAGLERLLDIYLASGDTAGEVDSSEALSLVNDELTQAQRDVASTERAMRDFLATTQFDPRAATPDQTAVGRPVTSPRDDRTVTELKAALIGLETQLIEAKQRFRPTSEAVRHLERSIEQTRQHLSAEVRVGAANYDRYNRLDRTLRTAEARVQELERRRSEVSLFTRIEPPATASRQVIEPPILPTESDWKARVTTLLLGSGLGLLLGIVMTGARESIDTTLRSPADVQRYVGVRVLATIPQVTAATRQRLENGLLLDAESASPPTALLRAADALASRVMIGGAKGSSTHGRVILVTSAHEREGKTFVSTLLARHLVALGAGHVLLLDLGAHTSLVPGPPCTSSIVRSDVEPAPPDEPGDLASDTAAAPADGRDLPARSSYRRHIVGRDVIGSRLQAFVDEERARFDWIVIDGRSVEDRGTALVAQAVDAVALVVQADRTRRHVVRHALDAVSCGGKPQVQVVLNRKKQPIPTLVYDRI